MSNVNKAALVAAAIPQSEIVRLVQEAQLVVELTNRKAEVVKYGSFSDRNPVLGKMRKCKLCGIRERDSEHQCRVIARQKEQEELDRKNKAILAAEGISVE